MDSRDGGEAINAHLAAAGVSARVDHRSLKEQAAEAAEQGDGLTAAELSRAPGLHMGKDATALHRRGADTVLKQGNEGIAQANSAAWDRAVAQMAGEGRLMAPHPIRQCRLARARFHWAPPTYQCCLLVE